MNRYIGVVESGGFATGRPKLSSNPCWQRSEPSTSAVRYAILADNDLPTPATGLGLEADCVTSTRAGHYERRRTLALVRNHRDAVSGDPRGESEICTTSAATAPVGGSGNP
ncbi:hypothetical protein GCM10027088_15460 [Nocardia goodfellowii]|uniref:Uncharacterized protein n=1 Tax=Nocardia goodfellowii TaxID=882446 RepID=A0ABS4QD98_9NOCA|nr:hypothetical protein [Nocardia goodfellowii]